MCWWKQTLSLWWWRCWWQSRSPGRPSAPHTHTCRFTAVWLFNYLNHNKSAGSSLQQHFITSFALHPHFTKSQPSTVVTPCSPIEALCYLPHHIQQDQKLGEPEDYPDPDARDNQCFRCFIIKHIMQTAPAAACSLAHRCTAHQWWTAQHWWVDIAYSNHCIQIIFTAWTHLRPQYVFTCSGYSRFKQIMYSTGWTTALSTPSTSLTFTDDSVQKQVCIELVSVIVTHWKEKVYNHFGP